MIQFLPHLKRTKNDVIQGLRNENQMLQNRVHQLEGQINLSGTVLVYNVAKLNTVDEYDRQGNTKIQSITQSVKSKVL